VVSFIAAKKQILGGAEIIVDTNGVVQVVEEPGIIQRLWGHVTATFQTPLSGLIWIGGLIMCAWGTIKLWGVIKLEKAKVRIKEAQINQEARREASKASITSAH